ncbi:hypothetical protein Tco_1028140 [Tanacetum coccineum]
MSDLGCCRFCHVGFEAFTVTYTYISSDDGSLDVGSPGVIEPPPPNFVPEPVYLEFMPPEDDVLLAEEQPLPTAISPTADSPGYITESDPEEDPEEDDEDLEEDPADNPADRDDDEEEEDEDEDEEEEEHLAPTDSVLPPAYRTTAKMSIRAQTPILFPFEAELRAELLSTSHPLPLPRPIVLIRTRASMAMMRAAAPSTYILAPRTKTLPSGTPPLLPIPLPTSSPPLLLPSTDCRADVHEVTLPPKKRLCIALGTRYKVGECSYAPTARPTRGFRAYYGFVGTLDAEIRRELDKEVDY